MKAGRNAPCPCGSGKKYKKCCLPSHREQSADERLHLPESTWDDQPQVDRQLPETSLSADEPLPPETTAATPDAEGSRSGVVSLDETDVEVDPHQAARDAFWNEFEACDYQDQAARFVSTFDSPDLLTGGMAFELLELIRQGARRNDDWDAFEILIRAFQERLPEVFDAEAAYYVSWLIDERVARGRLSDLPPLAKEMAAHAGDAIDTFSFTLEALAYHCDLTTLVEVMRIAWSTVKGDADILEWAAGEFVDRAFRYEMLRHCGQAESPDPDDPGLTERLEFYVDDVRQDSVTGFILNVTGQAAPITLDDRWRDDACERLCLQFLGHLIREQGVAPGKADLACENLGRYLLERSSGRLERSPPLYDPSRRPSKRKGKARRAQRRTVHLLCPDAGTLEPYLAGQLHFFSARYYTVAATMECIPAWLRFLESHQLIDAQEHQGTLRDLAGMNDELLRLWERYPNDPSLHAAAMRAWPEPQLDAQKP